MESAPGLQMETNHDGDETKGLVYSFVQDYRSLRHFKKCLPGRPEGPTLFVTIAIARPPSLAAGLLSLKLTAREWQVSLPVIQLCSCLLSTVPTTRKLTCCRLLLPRSSGLRYLAMFDHILHYYWPRIIMIGSHIMIGQYLPFLVLD
jgi:hypothetical protein